MQKGDFMPKNFYTLLILTKKTQLGKESELVQYVGQGCLLFHDGSHPDDDVFSPMITLYPQRACRTEASQTTDGGAEEADRRTG